MRKILVVSILLIIIASCSFAQCAANEVEVKVEITTDNWGGETYWTVKNLAGTVLLQGGQDGAYASNTSYSDSVCVVLDDCTFFEIYDGYGDGIYAPNGYKLYVDDLLISSGANDIEDYAIVTTNCPNPCGLTMNALSDFKGHLNGSITLEIEDLILIKNVFNQFPECLAESEAIIELAHGVVEDYDQEIGALFTTSKTQNGFSKDPAVAPGLELERAMLALQQGIFDFVFTSEVYIDYPQQINGHKFNSCESFPGNVDPPVDPLITRKTLIRANFEDPDGMNPYFNINGDGTEHALRPTGLYLSPGSVASITVPDSLVGQDYYIRVGAHEWDLSNKPTFKRLDRITKKFLLDSTTIEVFNPLGGAIAVLVPYGADDGIVEVSVSNAVEAPFFSIKSFYESPDFNAELSKPGPWAVFETDNVMYTIPKHSIIPGQHDLEQTLLDWDKALQGVNSIMARQIVSDKHNMYMIADVMIRSGAYSIGYPMSNTPLNFSNVPGPAYFVDGPGPNDETNFHESGHALAMSKFPGEVEALVNVPYIMAMNYGLNVDLNEAVNYSFVPNTFDIDRTATHRMVSNSFGSVRNIANATTNEVRYQHRGYGHYFEIVNMFGWCPLRNFWKQESIDFENGIDYGVNNQDIDSRIIRMSTAAQVDLRPLFHVFGIIPEDSIAVQDTMDFIGLEPSLILYERLQEYMNLIPEDNSAFIDYALLVYPNLYTNGPTSNPDYGVGWHYQKSLSYDAAEAQERVSILESIVELYFSNEVPSANENLDVCCILDTMSVNLVNNEVDVTGGVAPFEITIDTVGNTETIRVIDFDGCESILEFIISGVSQEDEGQVRLYPNPASTLIYIENEGSALEIEGLQILSINGYLVRHYRKSDYAVDISMLEEGMYIVQIELLDGKQINKRLMVLR